LFGSFSKIFAKNTITTGNPAVAEQSQPDPLEDIKQSPRSSALADPNLSLGAQTLKEELQALRIKHENDLKEIDRLSIENSTVSTALKTTQINLERNEKTVRDTDQQYQIHITQLSTALLEEQDRNRKLISELEM